MKQTASMWRRSRLVLGVAVAVVATLAGVQAAFSAASVVAPALTSTPPAVTSSRTATFTFTGPAKATFKCQLDGKGFVACTSPVTYASLADGTHQFQVKSVTSAGESVATPYSWKVAAALPSVPVITGKPSDPTSESTVTFTWTDAEANVTFQCSLENGPWKTCQSPYSWQPDASTNEQHQFAVRALDAAGNASAPATYSFKLTKNVGAQQPFAISGSVSGLVIGVWKPIAVTVTNPNKQTIYVSELTVAVDRSKDPQGCSSGTNLELHQSTVSSTNRLTVGAGAKVTLESPDFTPPEIRLRNLPTNQDACKGKSFMLTYTGTATN